MSQITETPAQAAAAPADQRATLQETAQPPEKPGFTRVWGRHSGWYYRMVRS